MCPVFPESLEAMLLSRANDIFTAAGITDARISFEPATNGGVLKVRTSAYLLFSCLYRRDTFTDDQQDARADLRMLCEEMVVQYDVQDLV